MSNTDKNNFWYNLKISFERALINRKIKSAKKKGENNICVFCISNEMRHELVNNLKCHIDWWENMDGEIRYTISW